MKNTSITVSLLLAAATVAFSPLCAGEPAGGVPPDFTAGGKKDDSHDWLLGPVRASIIPVLSRLSDRELALLLPDIIRAIETLAPTNEMWGDDIRQAGLDILSRRHIREGMELCVSTIEWRWGNDYQKRLEFLMRYGKNAKEVLPQLRKKRPEGAEQAANINKAIAAIEAATDAPKLVTLEEFIANASKSSPKKDNSNQ